MEHNIFAAVRSRIIAALRGVVPDLPDAVAARVEVTPAREEAHGDMATNAALLAAKAARRKPQDIAAALVAALTADPLVEEAAVAGPGFVNLRLRPAAWLGLLGVILRAGEAYGDSTLGAGVRVNVEYVSANPTGPMHIGHCRGAVVGDALANLLAKVGYRVTKEFYLNDAGNQVTALAWAAYFRYLRALGQPVTEEDFAALVPGGLQYRGDYLIPVGEALAAKFGPSLLAPDGSLGAPEDWLEMVRDFTIAVMVEQMRADLAALGVVQDVFASERDLVGQHKVDDAIARLDRDGLIYQGTLEPPKGKTIDDWEPREQLLFRATRFGDDVDRPLKKSDGSFTYFANDIAYHADKLARGFELMIDVWGADHGGYVKRMQAAVAALSGRKAVLDVKLIQLVKLMRAGEPVKMSKRAGEFVTLREVVNEVGRDAGRFMMLFGKNDAVLDFDLAKVIEQSRDNPVFYVQYAHVRCHSVFRNAIEAFSDLPADVNELLEMADLQRIADPAELALVRQIALYPRVVEAASTAHEPHRIAFYLFDLASEFHALWTLGNTAPHLRFIMQNDREMTLARLVLVQGVRTVLASGLGLLGVGAPNEMR